MGHDGICAEARTGSQMTRNRTTLFAVARAAQVSAMTASRAINGRPGVSPETREHVLKVASDLGYVVNRAAQKLSGGRSHIIGVIATDLDDQYVSTLIAGASEAAWGAGYETLVYSLVETENRPSASVVQLLRQISDGVIAVQPLEFEYLAELASINIPVVSVDNGGQPLAFPTVATDCYAGGCMAVQHLLELGHRRIAYIGGDERLASAVDRRHAYIETVLRHGSGVDPALLVAGDFTEIRGYAAMTGLLSLAEPPTAVFAANDLCAFGAIAAIRDAGLGVPDDISVIGFDDVYAAAKFDPPLTTVRQPLQEVARVAVNMLLALVAGRAPASPQVNLPGAIVVRSSTKAARGSGRGVRVDASDQ